MVFSSSDDSSRSTQPGITIIDLKKPTTEGTLTCSDMASVTDLDEVKSATTFAISGLRSAVQIATQPVRSSRRRQIPVVKRRSAKQAAIIHARNRISPQGPGKV